MWGLGCSGSGGASGGRVCASRSHAGILLDQGGSALRALRCSFRRRKHYQPSACLRSGLLTFLRLSGELPHLGASFIGLYGEVIVTHLRFVERLVQAPDFSVPHRRLSAWPDLPGACVPLCVLAAVPASIWPSWSSTLATSCTG